MLTYHFSIEQVASACLRATARLQEDLPADIASRLVPNRKASRHGTETRIFEFQIRDKFQPGLLDKKYFSYGVIYDPVCRYHTWKKEAGGPCQILVRFYANRQRIYDQRDIVIPMHWKEIEKAARVLHDFLAYENQQVIGIFRFFDAASVEELEENIYQAFLELMPYWHKYYASVIDAYGSVLTPEMISEIKEGRQPYHPNGPRFPRDSAYCRHVPERMRQEVFRRDDYRCKQCGCQEDLHADHVIPVAKGGLTTLNNLQTLCAACNLSKGGR